MKLGLRAPGRFDVDSFDAADLYKLRELGFTGADVTFTQDFVEFSQAQCSRVKAAFAGAGLDLVELGQYDCSFIDRDAQKRQESMNVMRRALERAAWLGSPTVITGGGSLNPKGQWFDHKENHSGKSVELLIQCMRELVKVAEDVGVKIGLECHTYNVLDSPETATLVVEAVDSPWLGIDLDPVNWITYPTYWNNGPFLHRMFDLLGEYILGGHAKDVRQEDSLIIHLNETHAGDGNLDYATYLWRMNQLSPDIYLMVEHTASEDVPAALHYIREVAARIGVEFAD